MSHHSAAFAETTLRRLVEHLVPNARGLLSASYRLVRCLDSDEPVERPLFFAAVELDSLAPDVPRAWSFMAAAVRDYIIERAPALSDGQPWPAPLLRRSLVGELALRMLAEIVRGRPAKGR